MNTHIRSVAAAVVVVGFTLAASAATPVQIDILPGESMNIVDREAAASVRVAVLGSPDFEVKSIAPESLRLAGAAIVKDENEATHVFEDVNGDGRLDLVVRFAARQLLLADGDPQAVLEGKTIDGAAIAGRDRVQTIAFARRSAGSSSTGIAEETADKLLPLDVAVEGIPGTPGSLAILGSVNFDARDIRLDSIRLNGYPAAKGSDGELLAYRDVNGDGREDVVISAPAQALSGGSVKVGALTRTGRVLRGSEAIESIEARAPGGALLDPVAPEPKFTVEGRNAFVIFIPDSGPANAYPSVISVSDATGVVSKLRVTLDGIVHTCFADLDIMLVAPNGQSLLLMSDVGDCGQPANASYLTFDDFAPIDISPSQLPYYRSTVRPSNSLAGDVLASPAPVTSGATALSAFNGIDPNGDWKLYVFDDFPGDSGQIRGGWSLDIITSTRVCNPSALAFTDGVSATSSLTVSGIPTNLLKITATLNGLTHQRPDDLDVMLVDPAGRRFMLMSDAGGTEFTSSQLTFDDDAWGPLGDEFAIGSGTYLLSDYEPGEVLPPPAPPGSVVPSLELLHGSNPNGTWQLFVADDRAGATGSLASGWCLDVTTTVPMDWCSPFAITIPNGAPGATAGAATPYPSTINFTGASGLAQSVEVKLVGLSHTYPADLDILLEAPSGRSVLLLSDVGEGFGVTNLDVTLDTYLSAGVPEGQPLGPGPYAPTNFFLGDTLPAPAPAPLSGLASGEQPNGNWNLWVADDLGGDWGMIAGGWCLKLRISEPYNSVCTSSFNPITIPAGSPGTTSGPAFPYPSTVLFNQEGMVLRKVRVRLQGLSHTYPDDLDVVLVGPQGQTSVLMSDAGGSVGANLGVLTFDEAATTSISDTGPLSDGAYLPAQYEDVSDPFPAPAPAGPNFANLSIFNGTDPHGNWSLYLMDDLGGDVGSLTNWCLDFFPLYPPAEVTNLRWSSKTGLKWDNAANATEYALLRGTGSDLGSLLTNAADSCVQDYGAAPASSVTGGDPPVGLFYWYLAVGVSGTSPWGPSGQARISGSTTARTADAPGACPP